MTEHHSNDGPTQTRRRWHSSSARGPTRDSASCQEAQLSPARVTEQGERARPGRKRAAGVRPASSPARSWAGVQVRLNAKIYVGKCNENTRRSHSRSAPGGSSAPPSLNARLERLPAAATCPPSGEQVPRQHPSQLTGRHPCTCGCRCQSDSVEATSPHATQAPACSGGALVQPNAGNRPPRALLAYNDHHGAKPQGPGHLSPTERIDSATIGSRWRWIPLAKRLHRSDAASGSEL